MTDRPPRYRLSSLAAGDLDDILDDTLRLFGSLQEQHYYSLLLTALERVAADPLSIGSKAEDAFGDGMRSFRVSNAAQRRGAAAHVLYYRSTTFADGTTGILVARVLHDRMDPERHIAGEPE